MANAETTDIDAAIDLRTGQVDPLERIRELEAENEQLEERQREHLKLIRRLSTESVTPEEAEEQRGQIAALIAEVGTLRKQLGDVTKDRDDARAQLARMLEVGRP